MKLRNRKRKEYIEMCQEQFDDMYHFYQKLGYTDQQCDKFTSSCFGADIRIRNDVPYNHNWDLRRKEDRPPVDFSINYFAPTKMARTRMPMPTEEICFDMGAAIPCAAPQEPEWNTAETKNVPETEISSPLDKPQMIFSANVNTASWSYIRNKISTGNRIDPNFVRIEEIINSYRYHLKKPEKDQLFSISAEHSECPWNQNSELLLIGLKGKKADKKVQQNLCFLVDVSGSMSDQWLLVQMSLAAIISKLGKKDIISIIAYSDKTVTIAKKMNCGNIDKCIDAVLSIDGIGGCTYGSEGLENAYAYLSDHYKKDANNRLFIFTDGDFNFGITSESGLSDYIYQKRQTGIYLSIVGYGAGNFKDNKMEALAENGNGNYTFVGNPEDVLDNLWDKLISNLVTIAKDVKISVELNPYYVKEYRLIGYDARVLTQKEFHDTEKAADGIGSEHNVIALIEFKKGTADLTYSTRYVSHKSKDNKDEFAFIEIHYKTPDNIDSVMTCSIGINDLNNKTDNIKIAALLAAFGLYIKSSAYKGSLDIPMLRKLLSEAKPENYDKYSHFGIIHQYMQYDT